MSEGAAPLYIDSSAIRHVRTVADVMAGVSGFVDAYAYLRIAHVFVANQAGNLILGGIAVGAPHSGGVLLPVISLVMFIVGASTAIALFDRPDGGATRIYGIVILESATLIAVSLLLQLAHVSSLGARHAHPVVVVVAIAATAFAMGTQTSSVRFIAHLPVMTTASTGSVANIGIALGRLGDHDRRPAAGTVAHIAGGLVCAYLAGAVAGAAWVSQLTASPLTLIMPAAVLLATRFLQRG